MLALILSYSTGAILYSNYKEFAKISVAATFSVGLCLIVFLKGELFTGNNLVMSVGMYEKKVNLFMVLKVWFYSYIGNFIGSAILAYLFVMSGANLDLVKNFIEPIVNTKLGLPVHQLLLRGILCNFIVCIGYLTSIKMKTESGKLMMMFLCVFAFVIAGFEHSVANMGIFSVAHFAFGGLPIGLVLRNLFWVTLGNIIGGGVLLGLPSVLTSIEE
jgi:nitrite transporter NirC